MQIVSKCLFFAYRKLVFCFLVLGLAAAWIRFVELAVRSALTSGIRSTFAVTLASFFGSFCGFIIGSANRDPLAQFLLIVILIGAIYFVNDLYQESVAVISQTNDERLLTKHIDRLVPLALIIIVLGFCFFVGNFVFWFQFSGSLLIASIGCAVFMIIGYAIYFVDTDTV